jgi:hypothetical protein
MRAATQQKEGVKAGVLRKGRSVSAVVARALITIILPLLLGACTSMPRYSYRTAGPECLEYAIAACRAAIVEDGLEAGLIHYIPVWGGGVAHAVIWVKDPDGVERIYDPSFNCYRTISPRAAILHKGRGLDLGVYALLLDGGLGSDTRLASD